MHWATRGRRSKQGCKVAVFVMLRISRIGVERTQGRRHFSKMQDEVLMRRHCMPKVADLTPGRRKNARNLRRLVL